MNDHRGFAGAEAPERWPPTRGRPRPEELNRSLDTLPGVGPSQRGKLAKLGLRTVRDLLEHRPRDYQQAVGETPISNLFGEEEAVIAGEVRRVSIRPTRRRLTILKAAVRDESGEISAVWFNQPWLADKLQPGTRLRLRGQLRRNEFHVRSYDLDGAAATADFAPVYPASEEVTSARLRTLVESALPHATDFGDSLPASLRARERLPLRFDALVALHRPRDGGEAERARRRLALDELFLLQVGLARIREGTEEATAPALGEPGELAERYRQALPFELTKDQEQAIAEIDADLAASKPMQRLLQGDVGSGKTVVALYALLRAVEAGKTGALTAPLTGSVKGDVEGAQILVGTHALIQEGVDLSELAVAVVDEQHRFGVEQRGALAAGRSPHVLHMTATPIPRTLALTVYGDLAVTEIAKPPANRKPIVTSWVTEERGPEAYRRLRKHLDAGRQAYVVCPLIEQSETSQARAAEAEAERLRRGELRDYRVGLLHGRLRPAERRDLMAHFKARELDVLVSTTVIEVGVDVPNATIMIVQEADRFGLAQLHQLRGRVGRGAEQSYCLLVSRAKEELTDKDLELRGEGQLLGTRQAGLSEFRFTRLRADRELLERARELAGELVAHEGPLNDEVDRFFAGAEADSLA